jgi:hypothetical protein
MSLNGPGFVGTFLTDQYIQCCILFNDDILLC